MKQSATRYFLFERNKRYIPHLALLTALEISRAYLGVRFAMVTRNVIDCAQSGTTDALMRAAMLLVAVIAGIMALYASAQYLRGWLRATLDREWKIRLSHTLLRGDYAAVSAYHSGELVNRLTSDVDAVNSGVIALVPNVAGLLTRLISAVWMMATMEPAFTVLAVACGIGVVGATGFFRKQLKNLHKQLQEANGKVGGFVQEVMEKLLAVQAMSVEDETEARERRILDSRRKLQMRQQRFSIMGTTGMYMACYLLEGAALVWCALRLMRGEISFGTLTAVVQLTGQLEGPILNFSGFIPQYVAMLMDYVFEQGNFGNKQTGIGGKVVRVLSRQNGIVGWMKLLHTSGMHHWEAAKRYAVLKPFAWIYSGCRYARIALGRKNAIAHLRQEKCVSDKRNELAERIGLSYGKQQIILRDNQFVSQRR